MKYALAPTAVRGTVRLVFDVSGQRFVVARELRRAKTGGVTVKNARLERLHDSSALGTVEDGSTLIAADGATSAAVEKLLGLSFDHFCQCVVLPQGAFSEFLRAQGADRRAILLALLGIDLYADMRKEANRRADLAAQRVGLLDHQLAGLADATDEAVGAAGQAPPRCGHFDDLTGTLTEMVSAGATVVGSRAEAERLADEHHRLTMLRPPAGLAELEADRSAVAGSLDAAAAADPDAETADAAARDLLAAGPARTPLERAIQEHQQQDALLAAMPASRAELAAAELDLAAAAQQRKDRVVEVEAARALHSTAAAAATEANAVTRRLEGEVAVLAGVPYRRMPPSGSGSPSPGRLPRSRQVPWLRRRRLSRRPGRRWNPPDRGPRWTPPCISSSSWRRPRPMPWRRSRRRNARRARSPRSESRSAPRPRPVTPPDPTWKPRAPPTRQRPCARCSPSGPLPGLRPGCRPPAEPPGRPRVDRRAGGAARCRAGAP